MALEHKLRITTLNCRREGRVRDVDVKNLEDGWVSDASHKTHTHLDGVQHQARVLGHVTGPGPRGT